jgi:uncharacterized protein YndB with AHSA1/START domain
MIKTASSSGTLHFEKVINAPLNQCVAPFRTARGLARWWDPASRVSGFRVGGTVTASDLPSFEIAAIVGRQLIAHRFTSTLDGVAIWSFVPSTRSKTRVVLDHVAEGNRDDAAGRTFYWQGLLENLAAVAERRPAPFVKGTFSGKKLPKGIRHRTMDEFVRAW